MVYTLNGYDYPGFGVGDIKDKKFIFGSGRQDQKNKNK
jgi:hypothetical protein